MIKNLDELKAFITWAKINKVKKVKLGETEVELSDLAFIDSLDLSVPQEPTKKEEVQLNQELMNDEQKEDLELLFHSSQ